MHRVYDHSRRTPTLVWLLGLFAVFILGAIDYLTGPELSFSIFYLLPIALVCWFAGLRYGVSAAVASSAIWLVADLASQAPPSSFLVPVWNAGVRLGFFCIIVNLEWTIKERHQNLEVRVAERTLRLRAEVAERKRAEARLQRYAQRLEILREIDRAMLATQSVESIAQAGLCHLRQLVPCDRANLALFDFSTQRLELLADHVEEGASRSGKRFSLRKWDNIDALLEPLRRGETHIVTDLAAFTLAPQVANALHTQHMRAMVNVPLVVDGMLIGALNLMARTPGAFVQEHLEICSEIANQLGLAIRHAQLLAQMHAGREHLQSVSQRLLNVQEAERRHIARELHDEIGQALTGLNLYLEKIDCVSEDERANTLSQARLWVTDLMERVRRLSLDLHPAMLDDLGLLPALLWQIDRYTAQTQVRATLRHQGVEGRRFTPEIETAVYRIMQEALTNVARHAGTHQVAVSVWVDQDSLGLQIEDRGSGFDPDAALAAGVSSGLAGMRERAALLGGKLSIESHPGAGTRLLAELPIDPAPPNKIEKV